MQHLLNYETLKKMKMVMLHFKPRMHKGDANWIGILWFLKYLSIKTLIYLILHYFFYKTCFCPSSMSFSNFLVIGWKKKKKIVSLPQECIKRVKLTCIHFQWNFESTVFLDGPIFLSIIFILFITLTLWIT